MNTKTCQKCGQQIEISSLQCPNCGAVQKNPISKPALLLLTFFFGGLGGHKFYMGKNVQGIFYLLFFWTFVPAVIALVEFFIYAFSSNEKLNEKFSASGNPIIIAVIFVVVGFVGISVIGILAAIAIPNFVMYRNKAVCLAIKTDANQVAAEIVDYFAIPTHTSLPPTSFISASAGSRPSLVIGNSNSPDTFTVSLSPSITDAAAVMTDDNRIIVRVTEGAGNCPCEKLESTADRRWVRDENGVNYIFKM